MPTPKLSPATLAGIWSGVPLAWDENDRLDERRYVADIERCLPIGAPGVYAAGSTGEFYPLESDEFRHMTDLRVSAAHQRGAPC